jgi:hypothetical protein
MEHQFYETALQLLNEKQNDTINKIEWKSDPNNKKELKGPKYNNKKELKKIKKTWGGFCFYINRVFHFKCIDNN